MKTSPINSKTKQKSGISNARSRKILTFPPLGSLGSSRVVRSPGKIRDRAYKFNQQYGIYGSVGLWSGQTQTFQTSRKPTVQTCACHESFRRSFCTAFRVMPSGQSAPGTRKICARPGVL